VVGAAGGVAGGWRGEPSGSAAAAPAPLAEPGRRQAIGQSPCRRPTGELGRFGFW
jgi:hypothetical protein